jgi:hypothetical protein
MDDIDRTEQRGRRAIGWGAATAMTFSIFAAIWSALAQLGSEIPARQALGSLYIAYLLSAIAVAGIVAMVFGMLELAIAGWREQRPLH